MPGGSSGRTFYICVAFLAMVLQSKSRLRQQGQAARMTFSALFAGAFLLRSAVLPFGLLYPSLMTIVALVYFGSNSFPLFYLRLNADRIFHPVKAESASDDKMKLIVERYRITKRESEIIRQVCQGKTNQQIADSMFISLQTVKDHTHRIYSKRASAAELSSCRS